MNGGTAQRISIIIPMRNEAARIEHVVEQIAAQDYPGEIEVLVGDGRSEDESIPLLRAAAERLGVDVQILDNPARLTAGALNACIGQATGDLIVRMDCHARYPTDYVSACVRASEESGAENVGGPTLLEGETDTERAVAAAMSSPFGGIGWSKHAGEELVEHDTVYCGAFRPAAFRLAGGFDLRMGPNEDEEFNLRLRRAGGRVVLDSRIRIWYTPRGSLRAVLCQYFRYGLYKVPVMVKHRRVASVRSLVPTVFVVGLGVLAVGVRWSRAARSLLGLASGTYAVAALVFGRLALRARRESPALLPRTAATFPAFHVGYGSGLLWGLLTKRALPPAAPDIEGTQVDEQPGVARRGS